MKRQLQLSDRPLYVPNDFVAVLGSRCHDPQVKACITAVTSGAIQTNGSLQSLEDAVQEGNHLKALSIVQYDFVPGMLTSLTAWNINSLISALLFAEVKEPSEMKSLAVLGVLCLHLVGSNPVAAHIDSLDGLVEALDRISPVLAEVGRMTLSYKDSDEVVFAPRIIWRLFDDILSAEKNVDRQLRRTIGRLAETYS